MLSRPQPGPQAAPQEKGALLVPTGAGRWAPPSHTPRPGCSSVHCRPHGCREATEEEPGSAEPREESHLWEGRLRADSVLCPGYMGQATRVHQERVHSLSHTNQVFLCARPFPPWPGLGDPAGCKGLPTPHLLGGVQHDL